MADGRWTMTEEELNRVVTGMRTDRRGDLPNHGMHRQIDARPGTAPEQCCAFCGSADLQTGFGGSGDGLGYHSALCRQCGGFTDFVYRDDHHKFFL